MADPGGSEVWGYGYVGARTDSTQQTNICLAIRLQTCVATFNPTCLSRITSAKGLIFLSLLIVGDVIVILGTRLLMNGTYFLMTDSNFCFKLVLLFQNLSEILIYIVMHLKRLVGDICYCSYCLFGPKGAAHL